MTTSGTLYRLTSPSGGTYIGITTQPLRKRLGGHQVDANRGFRTKIARAIRKYGIASFSVEVLLECNNIDHLMMAEVYCIAIERPKYNIAAGGRGVLGVKGYWAGKKRSPETIAKMSAARQKNPTRYWLGKTRPQSTKDKISASKTGRPQNIDPAVREAYRVRAVIAAADKRRRAVMCLSSGVLFRSAKDAAEFYGLNYRSVCGVCAGRRNQIYGLKFRYEAAK